MFESLTYAELITLRTEYRDKLRNAPHTQINTDWYRNLVCEVTWINTQLLHTEIITPNRL